VGAELIQNRLALGFRVRPCVCSRIHPFTLAGYIPEILRLSPKLVAGRWQVVDGNHRPHARDARRQEAGRGRLAARERVHLRRAGCRPRRPPPHTVWDYLRPVAKSGLLPVVLELLCEAVLGPAAGYGSLLQHIVGRARQERRRRWAVRCAHAHAHAHTHPTAPALRPRPAPTLALQSRPWCGKRLALCTCIGASDSRRQHFDSRVGSVRLVTARYSPYHAYE
jgi:hypothetical protein